MEVVTHVAASLAPLLSHFDVALLSSEGTACCKQSVGAAELAGP